MPPAPSGSMELVPTSNTPQPQAQANVAPGAEMPANKPRPILTTVEFKLLFFTVKLDCENAPWRPQVKGNCFVRAGWTRIIVTVELNEATAGRRRGRLLNQPGGEGVRRSGRFKRWSCKTNKVLFQQGKFHLDAGALASDFFSDFLAAAMALQRQQGCRPSKVWVMASEKDSP